MTRALAARRSYWWGRDPGQPWTYTTFSLTPSIYRTTLGELGAIWAEPYDAQSGPVELTTAVLLTLA